MSGLELDEEELQRLLDEGSASGQPMELANFRADLAQQGAGMTDSGGVDLPRGTKVSLPMDVAAPAPSRVPITPKAVDLTQEPPDDLEMAYASAQDRKARAAEAFERGSRQLVAGLTRTPVVASTMGPTDAVAKLMALRKQRGEDAQRNEQNRLGAAKFNYEQKTEAQKAAEQKARDERDFAEKEKEFKYRQENDALNRDASDRRAAAQDRMTATGLGIRLDDAARKKKEDEDKTAASDIPFLNGTLKLKPGLSDTERNQARTKAGDWNAADAAVGNFQSTLEEYARNPSVENKGKVTAALRTASSAFNSAIGGGAMSADEARAMSEAMGADILSPTGITAIAESVFGGDPAKASATISSRVRAARQANKAAALGKLRASGDYIEGGGSTQPASSPNVPAGKVVVSNGKETLVIDAGDVADAERDGFKRVGK